jgi:carbonic anhydrase
MPNLISQRAQLASRARLKWLALLLFGMASFSTGVMAAEHAAAAHDTGKKKVIEEVAPVANPKEMGDKVREALGVTPGANPNKKLTLMINGKAVASAAPEGQSAARAPTPVINPQLSKQYVQQRAAALAAAQQGHGGATPAEHNGEVHWAYEGVNGPQSWGQLKPEFNVCAIGKRQSPINIEDNATLQGPAEPIGFVYTPSNGTVINNGHTIQVDVQGDNSITVRGSNYRLLQFHFHTPSEEQVNFKRYAMVAHLVHKNAEGQLAVVAVLLEPGASNTLLDKVWTYMPLDTEDRVRMPQDMLNMNELLPKDQRYYQFMGSLTTPPCTEGVLWMVLKSPVQMSRNQYRMFTQLYPNNARPVQPVNGRPVRDAL